VDSLIIKAISLEKTLLLYLFKKTTLKTRMRRFTAHKPVQMATKVSWNIKQISLVFFFLLARLYVFNLRLMDGDRLVLHRENDIL